MPDQRFKTPILLNVFNRPECTQIVFNEIKNQKPKFLYIHCDGPRKDSIGDVEKTKDVAKIFETQVDWDCELFTLYKTENLGCGRGPASGISWFFENVEEGIILEDDMLPDPIFFQYCQTLLEHYRSNKDIYIISGGNIFGSFSKNDSYYFSRATRMWGWATWKRVWDKYDFDVSCDKSELSKALIDLQFTPYYVKLITNFYYKVLNVENKSYWDFQVDYMLYINRAINIMPNSHLVGNIGFTSEGTHTKSYNPICEKKIDYSRFTPFMHPDQIVVDKECDKITFRNTYYVSPLRIIRGKLKRIIKSLLGFNHNRVY